PYYKYLWQLVSGIHYETPEEKVRTELSNVSKKICEGILQFRPACASKTDLETLLEGKHQEKLIPFTKKLQNLLNLETSQCWEILCSYLTHEFRGSASSLAVFVANETNTTKLLEDIWGFYSLERMIVLKIIKNMLLFYEDAAHPFHEQYVQCIDKITLTKLRDSYFKQFKYLLEDKPASSLTSVLVFIFNECLTSGVFPDCLMNLV
uniref:Nucleoporin Nup188 N-terminal domain-containing protein n=1 Tax=Megaselia scalaris TaxID=36166 RepID=T1GGY8_MEGSC